MALFGLFNKSSKTGEMSFWGHIDALRGHLFRSSLVVIIISVVLFCYPESGSKVHDPNPEDYIREREGSYCFRHTHVAPFVLNVEID